MLAAQLLWGIGFTFYSGAEAAWLVDEVGTERAHPAFLQATQLGFALTVIGTLFGSFAFALGDAPALAVAGFCLSQALRNVSRPILLIWISQNAEQQSRATVISAYWQANALGQVAGSPLLGWVGSAWSLGAALGLGTLLYTAVLPLLLVAQRRWRRMAEAGA